MITFHKIRDEHLETLGKWRQKYEINRYMLTDYVYNPSAQKKWFEKLKESKLYDYTWVVYIDNLPIGYLAISEIHDDKAVQWGYYIGNDNFLYLGGIIPAYLYNYVFSDEFGCPEIYANVLSTNKKVISIHKNHGYKYDSVDRGALKKGDELYDIVYLTLQRKEWLDNCQRWHKLIMKGG